MPGGLGFLFCQKTQPIFNDTVDRLAFGMSGPDLKRPLNWLLNSSSI